DGDHRLRLAERRAEDRAHLARVEAAALERRAVDVGERARDHAGAAARARIEERARGDAGVLRRRLREEVRERGVPWDEEPEPDDRRFHGPAHTDLTRTLTLFPPNANELLSTRPNFPAVRSVATRTWMASSTGSAPIDAGIQPSRSARTEKMAS